MKIICIGSSLVNGFPLKRSQCWVSLWRQMSVHEIINKGVNGSTSSDMRDRFSNDVISHKPQMVVMMSGTNDFLLKTAEPSGVLKNFEAMCDRAIEINIKPVIATSIPVNIEMATEKWAVGAGFDYAAVQLQLMQLRDLIISHGMQNDIQVIDFHSIYSTFAKVHNAAELYVDGIHPTAFGHKILAESINQLLVFHDHGQIIPGSIP